MSERLDRSLRISHRTVLATIASCAVLSAIQPGTASDDAPDPAITTIAVALGLGVILARRAASSPVISPRTRVTLLLCSYAFAFGLAALGTFLAMTRGQSQIGLMFALAAGIFCLRPPSTADPSGSTTA